MQLFSDNNVFRIVISTEMNFFFLWRSGQTWAMVSSFIRFLDHTQRRTTDARTPLDK